jgi:hypothetical protein
MSVSILSVGAEVFQFIQGIESRYRIGGNGSMSPVFAAAFGELSAFRLLAPGLSGRTIAGLDRGKDTEKRLVRSRK